MLLQVVDKTERMEINEKTKKNYICEKGTTLFFLQISAIGLGCLLLVVAVVVLLLVISNQVKLF